MFSALPAAAGVIGGFVPGGSLLTGPISNALSGVINAVDPGAVRDADRQKRVDWMKAAAIAGSVLAARIILGAPPNVASHETGMWQSAAADVQSQKPQVWAAAMAAGPYWPTGAPFNMPNETAQIQAALSSMGASPVTNVMPANGGPVGEIVTVTPGPAANGAAQKLANSAGLSLIPTNVMWLAIAGGVAFLLLNHRHRES